MTPSYTRATRVGRARLDGDDSAYGCAGGGSGDRPGRGGVVDPDVPNRARARVTRAVEGDRAQLVEPVRHGRGVEVVREGRGGIRPERCPRASAGGAALERHLRCVARGGRPEGDRASEIGARVCERDDRSVVVDGDRHDGARGRAACDVDCNGDELVGAVSIGRRVPRRRERARSVSRDCRVDAARGTDHEADQRDPGARVARIRRNGDDGAGDRAAVGGCRQGDRRIGVVDRLSGEH